MTEDAWFAVRIVVAEMENQPWGPGELGPGEIDYEERITLWRAPSADAAIAYAEADAAQYVVDVGGEALSFAQAYSLGDDPGHGVEVFSLIRRSSLPPERYIDRHFDTGTEHQSSADSSLPRAACQDVRPNPPSEISLRPSAFIRRSRESSTASLAA